MKWGVFEFFNEIHVAPCNEIGIVPAEHLFDEICICEPKVETCENGKRLIIHNDMH